MKYLLIACLLVASCSKTPTTTPTPTTPSNPSTPGGANTRFIPNWKGGDTLLGAITDNSGNFTGDYDTVYTEAVNDTSFVIYQGVRYYVWWEGLNPNDTFKSDKLQYSNVVFSTTTQKSGAISFNAGNSASPHMYKDQQGVVKHQKQSVMFNDRSKVNFKGWNGFYISNTTY